MDRRENSRSCLRSSLWKLCVEGERVYDREIFKLEEHTERLFYSAKRMGIKMFPIQKMKLIVPAKK